MIYLLIEFFSARLHNIAFFIYDNLLVQFHYYCIIMCYSYVSNVYRGKHYQKTSTATALDGS